MRVRVSAKDSPAASSKCRRAKWYGKMVDIAVERAWAWRPFGGLVGVRHRARRSRPAHPAGLWRRDAPDAVHLEWHAAAPEFRVFRKLRTEAGLDPDRHVHQAVLYGQHDRVRKDLSVHEVQSIEKTERHVRRERTFGDVKTFKPVDKFPPAVPAGVTAVPGTRSIELVWDRNTEKDFASYRVYRDGKQIALDITAPAYSDRDMKPGVKYEYQMTALDNPGTKVRNPLLLRAQFRRQSLPCSRYTEDK